jgi:methyl-accepting chemotaxis protein
MDEIGYSVQELTKGSDEILIATSHMNDLTVQVVDAVKNVRRSEEKVSENIGSLGEFIDILNSGLQDIARSATDIRTSMEGLAGLASDLNAYTRELNRKMSAGEEE